MYINNFSERINIKILSSELGIHDCKTILVEIIDLNNVLLENLDSPISFFDDKYLVKSNK